MIEHENIIYIRDFSQLGGVETFTYELAKKYRDLDIAVVYKTAHDSQLKRVRKFCRTYQHTDQKIKCKVAIINYDITIIDYIDENAKIYQVIHGDYENPAYKWKPPTHDRIYKYLGITKHIVESFKRITGLNNVELCYNPLTIDESEPLITIVSATRLSVVKGKDRMIKLARLLDNYGVNYIWYVFTNDNVPIDSPNVIFMKPRLDVGKWIEKATYLCQLSDTEACSYSINEALYRNVPILVTPLPYLDEIGYKDGITGYTIEFDCSNLNEVVEKIQNVPSFNFIHLEDNYRNIFAESKSKYEEVKNMKYLVEALDTYKENNIKDGELGYIPEAGERFRVSEERLDVLLGNNQYKKPFVKIIEETKKLPKAKEEKAIKRKK